MSSWLGEWKEGCECTYEDKVAYYVACGIVLSLVGVSALQLRNLHLERQKKLEGLDERSRWRASQIQKRALAERKQREAQRSRAQRSEAERRSLSSEQQRQAERQTRAMREHMMRETERLVLKQLEQAQHQSYWDKRAREAEKRSRVRIAVPPDFTGNLGRAQRRSRRRRR